MIDNSGVVQNTIVYDGFGNITSESNASFGDRYKGTGREWDAEAKLQYSQARYYDPAIGRWISRDPLGFEAGDSNLYRYVNNQPVMNTDPSGLHLPAPSRRISTGSGFPIRVSGIWSLKQEKDMIQDLKATYKAWTTFQADLTALMGWREVNIQMELKRLGFSKAACRNDWKSLDWRNWSKIKYLKYPAPMMKLDGGLAKWFGVGDRLSYFELGRVKLIVDRIVSRYKRPYSSYTYFHNSKLATDSSGNHTWSPWTAYSVYYSLYLYKKYWGHPIKSRQALLAHELTHYYASSRDYGYVRYVGGTVAGKPERIASLGITVTVPSYRASGHHYLPSGTTTYLDERRIKHGKFFGTFHNADTYGEFLYEYYL